MERSAAANGKPEGFGEIATAAPEHAAHEAWESGWRQTRGPEKRVLQAIDAQGFARIEDVGPSESIGRYFRERSDGLRPGRSGHLVRASTG